MKKNTKTILSVILSVISIIYVLPVLAVVMNSFKQNTFVKTDTFALPTGEMSAGFDNFIKGMTFGNYPFVKSVLYSVEITLLATFLILLCTSMAAWYIARVDSLLCKAVYFLCVFSMVVPMLKPTMISVGILEIMWVWNDYLLPVLVLDINKYRTIPIHIQYLKGSYGTVDLGATMALILMSIIPVIIFYLSCQKYIIKGVAAGAVKG